MNQPRELLFCVSRDKMCVARERGSRTSESCVLLVAWSVRVKYPLGVLASIRMLTVSAARKRIRSLPEKGAALLWATMTTKIALMTVCAELAIDRPLRSSGFPTISQTTSRRCVVLDYYLV